MRYRNLVASIGALTLPCVSAPVAQTPSLIADVNSQAINPSSSPGQIVAAGGALVFAATLASVGEELFVSLGQPGTSRLVRDIYPGPNDSRPLFLTAVGSTVYFVAEDGVAGRELWKTDGTAAGTVLVRDIEPGAASSLPSVLTEHAGLLYFVASDRAGGKALWRSDGSPAGTVLVAPVGFVTELFSAGSALLFPDGSQLWRSNGTTAGTVLVRAFPTGLRQLTAFLGATYFGVDGVLWKTDGTAGGTVLATTLSDPVTHLFAAQGILYGITSSLSGFVYQSSLFSYTPTSGVVPVASGLAFRPAFPWNGIHGRIGGDVFFTLGATPTLIRVDPSGAVTSLPVDFTGTSFAAVGNVAYFAGRVLATGPDLWQTDGTVAGTVPVPGFGASPNSIVVDLAGTGVVYAADDGVAGEELWASQGTPATTRLVDDINPAGAATPGSMASQFVDLFGVTLFTADDGLAGTELWKTDGTNAGTVLVRDINPGPSPSRPRDLTRVGARLFFTAAGSTARFSTRIWETDGTGAGTRVVEPNLAMTSSSTSDPQFTAAGGLLFFQKDEEVWVSDGTAAGTHIVRQITPASPAYVPPMELTGVGSLLYFSHDDGVRGRELWRSDGTTAGTVPLDIAPGSSGSWPASLAAIDDVLYFAATDRGGDRELWRSDGTPGGTRLVHDIRAGASSDPRSLVAVGSRLFFLADDGVVGRELWMTDGSAAGTVLVANLSPPGFTTSLDATAAVGDRLFFAFTDSIIGRELWVSDGTSAGTVLVKDIAPGSAWSTPRFLTAVGDRRVWFVADDRQNGAELWRSDGTTSGTSLVADLNPGAAAANIPELILARGRLRFSADDGVRGVEPYQLFPGASAQSIGDGCGAIGRTPRLSATDPILGSTCWIHATGAMPGAPTYVALGVPRAPLPLGAGCLLYLDPGAFAVFAYVVPAGASWSAPLFVPAQPGLAGLVAAVQAMSGPTNGVIGVDVTNGVYLTIGR